MYDQTDVYPYRRDYRRKAEKRKRLKRKRHLLKDYAGTGLTAIAKKTWYNIAACLSWEGFIVAAAAFFLGRATILKELMPFGPAFLIAVIVLKRSYLPAVFLATLAGVFTTVSGVSAWENLMALTLLAVVSIVYPINYEKRWLIIPLMVFVSIILGKGVLEVFFQAAMYRWVSIIFEAIFAAALAAAFLVVLNALGNKGFKAFSPEETLCLVIISLAVLGGMGDLAIGDFSLQRLVGSGVVMLIALGGGAGAGAAAGTLMGVIPSITQVASPSLAGSYALGGLLAGIFNDYGKPGAAGGYILGNMIFSIYLLGKMATITHFGEIFAASILLILVPPGWRRHIKGLFAGNDATEIHTQLAGISGKKVKNLANVFSELARSFNETAGTTVEKNFDDDMPNVMNLVAEKVCAKCPMVKKCWKTDVYRTYKNLVRLFSLAENNDRVTQKDISAHINSRCTRTGEIAAAVNFLVETHRVDKFWRRKLDESRDVVAVQLTGVAEVMQKLVDSLTLEVEKRGDLEAVVARELTKQGVSPYEISIFRRGRKDFEINLKHPSCGGIDTCTSKVIPVVSRVLGRRYAADRSVCPIHTGAANCQLQLIPSWTFRLETGVAQVAKKGTAICGDKVDYFDLPEGKKVLLISDGMGVGPKAARESNVTVNLLHRLLETGFSTEVAVKTVNSIMAMRSLDDSFTTLDLAMVDLYSGECEFVKIGSAPSWIKRGHRVEIMSRGNLPMGIIKNIEVESLKEKLQLGDLVIMVSDGVLDQQAGEQGILAVLKELKTDDPQQVADKLLQFAIEQNQGVAVDDITVLVARVDRNMLHV